MNLGRLCLIGAGNMGEALLKGLLDRGMLEPGDVTAAEKVADRAEAIGRRYGIKVSASIAEAAASAAVVLLAVKPQDVEPALAELKPVAAGKLLVSICAGVAVAKLEALLPAGTAVVRVMPNAPALAGCGASVYCTNAHTGAEARARVEALLAAVGDVHRVEKEGLLDAVTGLSGSGPAYAYLFLEALADGGVLMGLPRDLSRALAAQTLLGAAQMAKQGDHHTAELKDRVASPGGTTIAGLRELERGGFRGAVVEAVRAATLRSKELGG
ncbi:MAG: pyrroline-5-carboxylate reductase [Deltaproteobacteria bacterium]|nr:pyrroline-5-carboxylate reductase [Deltaproteobacteria bacterium]